MAKALEWEQAALKERNADSEVQRKLHSLVAEAGEMASAGNLTLDAARDVVGRMMEATGLDSPDYYTIEGWFNEWLEQKRGTASASSIKTYGFAVNIRFILNLRIDDALEALKKAISQRIIPFIFSNNTTLENVGCWILDLISKRYDKRPNGRNGQLQY